MAARVPRRSVPGPQEGGARLTGEQVSAINRFPDDNPNPVLRIDHAGVLIYANPASAGVRVGLGVELGDRLPADVLTRVEAIAEARGFVEVVADSRTYAVWPVVIEDLGFTNLYGMDVTAERAIVKFPDQNPNPVLRIRWDGTLVYVNPAGQALVSGLGLAIDSCLSDELRVALTESARSADRTATTVESGGRAYALLPVDVPEFGFINVYGTDVTAARERERLARENERLLLNILPEPIAKRLRDGEPLIADRFDDVTLLFADIVEFTRLSSTMSAAELVGVLNDIFTVFDELVERHGLEKIKTIGDAYMIVGGLSDGSRDHTSRVASLALELTDAVGRIECAARLGITFRIGIHAGPVVAGVIGTKKFIYDVWGDTVNLASRMESMGVPGRIQVSQTVAERLGGDFHFEARGPIDVKGKGIIPAYFLVDRIGGPATAAATKARGRREEPPAARG